MKKLIPLFVILAFLSSGFVSPPAHVVSDVLKTVRLQESQLANVFTFEQLGYAERLMVGPFDTLNLAFSLPANVNLATGSSISLKYAIASSGGSGSSTTAVTSRVGGTLLVYFNDELIDTIVLEGDGLQEKEIIIPSAALNIVDNDGRYRLRLFLQADINCRYDDLRTTLIVSKASRFNFQYGQVLPKVDLSLLPRPIYQPDSILPTSALVVIPDQPDAFEMQAALNTVAGLGSMTGGKLNVKIAGNGDLTSEMVATNYLIFVGLAEKFPNLEAVNFPISVSGTGVAISQGQKTDGIIEASLSPWNPSNIVLYVGGNSQEAVVKASQAFSTGNIIAVEKPDVSLISTVNPLSSEGPAVIDQTFQSLGYPSRTIGLFGENYITYLFYVSPEQANSTGAYVDLVLTHSNLLNYDSTGVTVLLNDEVVGGLRLSEDSPVVEQIKLVPGVLRRGINRLEIFSEIVPFYSCYSSDLQSTWITINETSNIHMPTSGEKLNVGENVNLRDFPYMFLSERNLSNLAFIFASKDQVSWDYASQVAYYIGAKGSIPFADIQAVYADNVPDEILKNYNLLVFGQASKLPIISRFNDLLPAPFKSGSDEAVQPSMLVNYSLLPDTSVGYLQMLPSPWNPDRVILAVMGNTANGIPMAGATLTKDDLVARLAGNFAVLYEDQVVTTDTRLGVGKESIISQLPIAVTTTPSVDGVTPLTDGQVTVAKPQWMLPVIGVLTLVILGFLVFMLRKESNANKKPKDSKQADDDANNMSSQDS